MFHKQINGEISDICETIKDGVPYSDLNSAGETQVDVDVVNTLQKFYGFSIPIFIDNRESVSQLPDIDCQIINLYVSEKDKEMRIEY